MATTQGFASRDTTTTFRQFPHRDEAAMADIEGMNAPGWSNSQSEQGNTVTEAAAAPDEAADKAVKTPAKKTAAPKKG